VSTETGRIECVSTTTTTTTTTTTLNNNNNNSNNNNFEMCVLRDFDNNIINNSLFGQNRE